MSSPAELLSAILDEVIRTSDHYNGMNDAVAKKVLKGVSPVSAESSMMLPPGKFVIVSAVIQANSF